MDDNEVTTDEILDDVTGADGKGKTDTTTAGGGTTTSSLRI
jgi:hypothetical protein